MAVQPLRQRDAVHPTRHRNVGENEIDREASENELLRFDGVTRLSDLESALTKMVRRRDARYSP